jgi:hypothetical protein
MGIVRRRDGLSNAWHRADGAMEGPRRRQPRLEGGQERMKALAERV